MRGTLLALTFTLAAASFPASADHVCTVPGTDAGEVLNGTGGADVICARGGNDVINAGGGDDVILPGEGTDVVNGEGGTDTASYEEAAGPIRADLQASTAEGEGSDTLSSIENLMGSSSDDVLLGDGGVNDLRGRGGTDVISGRGGADVLEGGDGEDHLRADPGSSVDGGPGSDVCPPGPVTTSCVDPSPPDADDTFGFLDVHRVDTTFGDNAEWRLHLTQRVKRKRMWDSGYALVHLDTSGGPGYDYHVMVRATRKGFRAALWRGRSFVARLPFWRTDIRNLSFALPLHLAARGEGRAYYRWRVQTMTDRCRGWCMDVVGEEGSLVQPYPGVG